MVAIFFSNLTQHSPGFTVKSPESHLARYQSYVAQDPINSTVRVNNTYSRKYVKKISCVFATWGEGGTSL